MTYRFYIPYIGELQSYKDWFDSKSGYELDLPTLVMYTRPNEHSETPSKSLTIKILGFGFSIYWDEVESSDYF